MSSEFRIEKAKEIVSYLSLELERDTQLGTDAKLADHVRGVKKLFDTAVSHLSLTYCRDHAELHDRITYIGRRVALAPDLLKTWKVFLRTVHGIALLYPDKKQMIALDFSSEIECLEHTKVHETRISLGNPLREQKDRDAIWAIINESFGAAELPSRDLFEGWYSAFTLLVAREKDTNTIVGILLFENYGDHHHLSILARKASAAKRGIGVQLMQEYLTQYVKEGLKVKLFVREGHVVAQKLYEHFGFKAEAYHEAPKACPPERDLLMTLTK